ncbi:MAG: hypothetical protein IT537_06550 [Hyphomicrobiales bacterium]|nr:hypothetical protein [Hyphomicrobiales bacterium]
MWTCSSLPPQQVLEGVRAGRIKAFGITSKDTSPQFPTAASMAQTLGENLAVSYWHALLAPAGTPKPIIDKISATLQGIMDDPQLVKSWAETGVAPYPRDQRTPQAAQALLRSEIKRWGEVVRANNIQAPDQ